MRHKHIYTCTLNPVESNHSMSSFCHLRLNCCSVTCLKSHRNPYKVSEIMYTVAMCKDLFSYCISRVYMVEACYTLRYGFY